MKVSGVSISKTDEQKLAVMSVLATLQRAIAWHQQHQWKKTSNRNNSEKWRLQMRRLVDAIEKVKELGL